MTMNNGFKRLRWVILLSVPLWTALGLAQDSEHLSKPTSPESPRVSENEVRELREQLRELQTVVARMRSDWEQSRAETAELRRDLEEIRRQAGEPRDAMLKNAVARSSPALRSPGISSNIIQNAAPQDDGENQKKGEHASSLEEEYQLLSGKVDDQYQTKVESASKYRLRLSGIVLIDRKSTRLNSSHLGISYAVFCL